MIVRLFLNSGYSKTTLRDRRREVCAAASFPRPRSWRGEACRYTSSLAGDVRAPRVDATFMSLENRREQGMPGARCTRGLVCKIVRKTHTSIQVQRKHSGIPCAMVLRLMARSPRRRILSCHRHRRIKGLVAPGWADIASADLTPATGVRTTRFCRTLWRRRLARRISLTGRTRPAIALRADAAASTASQPAFRDDRDPPLFSGETRRVKSLICPTRQAENFLGRDWTGILDLPVVATEVVGRIGAKRNPPFLSLGVDCIHDDHSASVAG